MTVWYNELDPYCAEWLRNLIAAGQLPAGDVDERDIRDIRPVELRGYRQLHFFAGIGGWPLALRLAGWGDDAPVWTGSCPCQPFSAAGRRLGAADERHLWPHWHFLVEQCGPPVVLGEQVASKAGREWLAGVRADLEALGYGVGTADLCAAGAGAPHIRQRLFWMADAECDTGRTGRPAEQSSESSGAAPAGAPAESGRRGLSGGMANGFGPGLERVQEQQAWPQREAAERSSVSFWGDFDVLPCADGKTRRVEPGTFPLAHGVPARVGKLRAYGNAIVPQVAAEFVRAFMETRRGPCRGAAGAG